MATFNPNAVGPPQTQPNTNQFGQPMAPNQAQVQQASAQAAASRQYFQTLAQQAQSNRVLMGVAQMQADIGEQKLEAQRSRFAQMLDEAKSFFSNALNQLTSTISSLVSRVDSLENTVTNIQNTPPPPPVYIPMPAPAPAPNPDGGVIVDRQPEDRVVNTNPNGDWVRSGSKWLYTGNEPPGNRPPPPPSPAVRAPPGTPINKAPAPEVRKDDINARIKAGNTATPTPTPTTPVTRVNPPPTRVPADTAIPRQKAPAAPTPPPPPPPAARPPAATAKR